MSATKLNLEIGGKERLLYFGMLSMEVMAGVLSRNPQAATYAAVYGGLKNGCVYNDSIEDFTYQHVVEWVDSLMLDEAKAAEYIQKINQAMEDSQYVQKFIQKAADALNDLTAEQPKKKVVRAKQPTGKK